VERRDRVAAALQGSRVDRVPLALWKHYHHQAQTAEGLARATVDLYRKYDPDLLVVAPTPYYLAEAWGIDVRSFNQDDVAPHLAGAYVVRPTDWRGLPEPDLETSSLQRELRALRLVRKELGPDLPLILLLDSPLTTADTLCNGRILRDLRTFGNDVRAGLAVIADVTRAFALASLEAGADGVLYCTRWAGRETLRAREQRDFVQRFDLEILEALALRSLPYGEPLNVLYMGGDLPNLDLAERYPVRAVCWETWRAAPSLADARRRLRCGLMGGINPTTFVSGRQVDIQAQVQAALAQTEGWRLILAPTGPLPPRARPELLAALRNLLDEV
jgi:uroporphyrinogen decarboxylase